MRGLRCVALLALVALASAAGCATSASPAAPEAPKKYGWTPGWNTSGGSGSGTVTTLSPVSGDGSVGSPVTVAAGQSAALTALVNAATTSLPGLHSAADKTLSTFIQADWKFVFFQHAKAAIPTLTGFRSYPTDILPRPQTPAGTLTGDALMEGGGYGNTGYQQFGGAIFKLPKTGVWAYGMDIKFPAPVTAQSSQCGIGNSGGVHTINFQSNFGTDATHFIFVVNATSFTTAQVADGTRHSMWFEADGTNVKAYFDGTLIGTTVQTAVFSDEGMYPYCFGSTATPLLSEIAYGFVRQ